MSIISIQFGLAQEPIWTRSFRSGQDVLYEKSIYKTVEIAVENPIENTVEWKVWMLSDIQINHELNNLLDYRTQAGMTGVGSIISPVVDSGYFNYSAAHRVCPTGWRIPRIGEWDTLMVTVTPAQRSIMFPQLNGYRAYSFGEVDNQIHKVFKVLDGGYWWAEPDSLNNNSIKFDDRYNYDKGKGDLWDRARVRCIKIEEFE